MSADIRQEHPGTDMARELIGELDAYLDPLYPKESQHGYSVEKLVEQGVEFFVLYEDEQAAGCCGVQFFNHPEDPGEGYAELKRMYVREEFRGRGYAKMLMKHLEDTVAAKGFTKARLETGISQPEAIGLCESLGYYRIPPFGDYREDPLSYYYEKPLGPSAGQPVARGETSD